MKVKCIDEQEGFTIGRVYHATIGDYMTIEGDDGVLRDVELDSESFEQVVNILGEIPESGQFVAVWRAGGRIWSNTYQIESGKVYSYVPNIQADPWLYVCNKAEFIKIMPGGLEIIQ